MEKLQGEGAEDNVQQGKEGESLADGPAAEKSHGNVEAEHAQGCGKTQAEAARQHVDQDGKTGKSAREQFCGTDEGLDDKGIKQGGGDGCAEGEGILHNRVSVPYPPALFKST